MSLSDCHLISLPKHSDARGGLTFVENQNHIPFDIQRVYYLYDMPLDTARGAHGHKQLRQLIIAISGSFDIVLDDGTDKQNFHLDRPDQGLYVCPMIWRDISKFSTGAVCLVLASELYEEEDYFRDYGEFLKAAGCR